MKRLLYSLGIGSSLPCLVYFIGRNTHSFGPPGGGWFLITGSVLIPGYFLLGLLTSVFSFHLSQSQSLSIALTILLDCLFWSLVVRMLWEAGDRVRVGAAPRRT